MITALLVLAGVVGVVAVLMVSGFLYGAMRAVYDDDDHPDLCTHKGMLDISEAVWRDEEIHVRYRCHDCDRYLYKGITL